MKYILYTLIIVLLFTGCSRRPPSKPHTKNTSHTKVIKQSHAQKQNSHTVNSTLSRLYTQHKGWKGTPYRYGGLSKKGIDCSGFIYQTFNSLFNIKLPRSTSEQVAQGKRVYKNQLHAGDLVFFKTGRKLRHVGIYLEKGKFLHASSSKGVMISNIHTKYWKNSYWQARRIL